MPGSLAGVRLGVYWPWFRHATSEVVARCEQLVRALVDRGATLAVPRETLPPLEEDEYYAFQLVGLEVEEEGGRVLGRVRDVLDYPANDVLELDSGLALPLVEACVRKVDVEGGRIVVAPGFAAAP